jgi:hypothetical protein
LRIIEDGVAKGDKLLIDQSDLETVVPKISSRLMIVNGRGRGSYAVLLKINEEVFNVDIRVSICIISTYLPSF